MFERVMARRNKRARLVTGAFLLVMLSNFAYFSTVGALQPSLPRYVKGELGATEAVVGLVIGVFSFAAILLRPWTGRIGDERGRRVLIIGGGLLCGVSVLAYTVAGSVPVLLALRILTGIGEAFFYVGAATIINDLAPEERRGEALSYFSLSLFGGLALGPIVGEWLFVTFNADATWIAAGAFSLIAGSLGFFMDETAPDRRGAEGHRRLVHPAALVPGSVLAANIWGLATFSTFIPLYALQVGLGGSRWVFATSSVVLLLIRGLGARLPDKLGPARAARFALAAGAIGMTTIGWWDHPVGLFVGTIAWSIGHALAFPALMTMAIRGAPASERGSVVGTFTSFFDLAFGVGAVSAGGIAEILGYRGSFVAAGAVAALGLTMLLVRAARRSRMKERGEIPIRSEGEPVHEPARS